MRLQRLHLPVIFLIFVLLAVFCVFRVEGGRGGGGSGGGGRGGGGSRGGFGLGGRGGGKSSPKGKSLSTRQKVGLIAGGGVASYAAYRGYKASHSKNKDKDSPDFDIEDGGGGEVHYKVQEKTAYSRGEGFGMSALGLILLILGIIGVGFLIWCCFNVGAPFWEDRQSKRNRTMDFPHIVTTKGDDDIPLRETPSTATPSPK